MIFPLFVLLTFVFAFSLAGGEEVKSLRGANDIPAGSNPSVQMDWQPKDSAVARTFMHQPPLIPHTVNEYNITTSQNDCLDCHGEPDSGAPKPYKSHYLDRDGKTTVSVSSQRYFCNQCHVGQVDEKPLVENTFKSK